MNQKESISFLYIVDEFGSLDSPPGIRSMEISKRLINYNINPVILTKSKKKKIVLEILKNTKLNNLRIYFTSFSELKNRYLLKILNYFFRFDFYLGWVPQAYYKGKEILKENNEIKFIYAAGPPFYIHIIAFLLHLKFKIPLIIEYRDLWSFNPYLNRYERWLNQKIDVILEKNIIKSAKGVITVSPALEKYLKQKFPTIKKTHITSIPNGVNYYENIKKGTKKIQNSIIFTFAGTLYRKRSIIPLLVIISKLNNQKLFYDLSFKIKIFGHYNKALLRKYIHKLKIEKLVFLKGHVPRSKIFKEIKKSTLAIHVGENLNYPTIAFKVWDYLTCNKKILYLGLKNSYTADFLGENDFGIVLPLDDLNRATNILKNLILDLKQGKFQANIDINKLKMYSWDYQVNKLNYFIKKYFSN